jgi:NitT/TauT family transport system substrate-binding protein
MMKNVAYSLALLAPLSLGTITASAQDALKVVIGQINNWENQAPTLGQDAGIFKKHGLVLENVGTQGAGETIQPVISGSADIGAGVGLAGVMRAFSRGAPVRVLAPAFTGSGDIYWYVRGDSPIKTLQDATDRHTIAYSTNGSTSHNVVTAFGQELGVKAKPTATGGPPGTFTLSCRGRSISAGRRNQTVRVLIVNDNTLKQRNDAVVRFMQAYRETIDWMYSSPDAIRMYATKVRVPEDIIKASVPKFHPKEAMQTDTMVELDAANQDAVRLKFLDKPLTREQLQELVQIPPRK